MRALVLRDFGKLVVDEIPAPVPSGDEVLLRIIATGICGSDVHGYTGESGRRAPGQVMGHETVGLIESLGPQAPPELAIGTVVAVNPVISCRHCDACQAGRGQICRDRRVVGVDPTIQAAFAELLVVPGHNVVPLPEGTPTEYGALVEPLAVGYHAVTQGRCTSGDRVLVAGGGPVGQACVLAVRRVNASIVVSEPDPRRRTLINELGTPTIDPTRDDVATTAARLLGAPATLAIDAVGLSASLTDCLSATAPGSRVVLVGMHDPHLEISAYSISTAERTVIGSFCYSARDFTATATWVGEAGPELASLIEEQIGLTDAPTAFANAASGRAGPGKVLVLPNV
jgi:threonine dehydrogenase-like Zn-dependent dehydrogenase